jgi:Fe-S cluster biogenesis protein NfuA/nitrite reductase/ring-hydroxylating ferredoxin subunit
MADRSEELMERVQALSAQLEGVRDPYAKGIADDLVGAIMQLYGEGLERIFAALEDAPDVRAALTEDGVVASLMLLHDLYPRPLEERVQEALDSVRPYMESHGGDVELLGVQDGVAHLRLVGHCKGCPASQATLQTAIETAIEEAAPDLLGLEVEGVVEPPKAPATNGFELPMVQSNGNGHAPTWTALAREPPSPGTFATLTLEATDVLVANVGGTLLAYRDQCGGCGAPLARAEMTADGTLTCGVCERHFDLRHAGRDVADDTIQIAPIPLLRGGEGVRVALTT